MINFETVAREVGLVPPLSHEYEKTGRIDDAELAHDMALAMDPHMEDLIAVRGFRNHVSENPDDTFRRLGEKGKFFLKLVDFQKERGVFSSLSQEEIADTSKFIKLLNNSYVRSSTEDHKAKATNISNGFADYLAKQYEVQVEGLAYSAGGAVFYENARRKNLLIYKELLTDRDIQVFSHPELEGKEIDASVANNDINDINNKNSMSPAALLDREYWGIFCRKLTVRAIASTLGSEESKNFSRSDLKDLSMILRSHGKHIVT